MMVVVDVRIEVRPPRLDHDLAQEADVGELMQRVVDGGERHANMAGERLAVQRFGGDVAIAAFEQQPGERKALASGPQARLAELLDHSGEGPRRRHVTDIRRAATKIKRGVQLWAI